MDLIRLPGEEVREHVVLEERVVPWIGKDAEGWPVVKAWYTAVLVEVEEK